MFLLAKLPERVGSNTDSISRPKEVSAASSFENIKRESKEKEDEECPESRPWNLTDNDECARMGVTHLGSKIGVSYTLKILFTRCMLPAMLGSLAHLRLLRQC